MSTILLLFALTACDRAPADKAEATAKTGPVMTMQQPPQALRGMDLGPSFVASVWGPDVTEAQVAPFDKAAEEAALKEASARQTLTEAQLALTTAVAGDTATADLDTRVNALVKAERDLANVQVDGIVALIGLLDATQLANRAKAGIPRVLVDLATDHPVTRESNPFGRVKTDRFENAELASVITLKTEVQGCLVGYDREEAEANVELGKLDLGNASWPDTYKGLVSGVLDAWEECRLGAVQRFTHFTAKLPKERRQRFMLDDGFVDALRIARGGMMAGNLPEGGRPMGGPGMGGPGMGGPGMGGPGMGADGQMGEMGGDMGGPGMGGPGMGGPGMGGPGMGGPGMGGPGMGGPGMGADGMGMGADGMGADGAGAEGGKGMGAEGGMRRRRGMGAEGTDAPSQQ